MNFTRITSRTLKIFAIAFFSCFAFVFGWRISYAATNDTWIGSGSWSTGANWSTGSAPGSSNIAIFSASSTASATISSNVNVAGITITSDYTGTVTQGSHNVTVGTSSFSQANGVWSSGSDFADKGSFTLSGGSFTNTSGTVSIGTSTISTSFTVDNFSLYDSNFCVAQPSLTIATGTVLTTTGNFELTCGANRSSTPYLFGGGVVDIQGDIWGGTGYGATGTIGIVLDGSGSQHVDVWNPVISNYFLFLPNLTINKSGGTVTLENVFGVEGNWTNTSNTTIIPGTSTVIFGNANENSPEFFNNGLNSSTISGTSTFNNVIFGGTMAATIPASTTLTLNGDFMEENQCLGSIWFVGGGTIDVSGNFDGSNDASLGCGARDVASGTVSIVMDGTSTQILDDSSEITNNPLLYLPNLTIAKTSGSVIVGGTGTYPYRGNSGSGGTFISGDWTNSSSVSLAPSSTDSFVEFNGCGQGNGNFTISGATSTFGLLAFGAGGGCSDGGVGAIENDTYTIATGTTLIATNLEMDYGGFDGNMIKLLGGGTINVTGNLGSGEGAAAHSATGTPSIILDGTSTQILNDCFLIGFRDSDCTVGTVYLPNLTINKSSGIAAVEGLPNTDLRVTGDLAVTKGELSLATGTVDIALRVDGNLTVNAGTLLIDTPSSTAVSTLTMGSSTVTTVNGVAMFDGSGSNCGTTIPNDIALRSAQSGKARDWTGTGEMIMRYVDVKDQTSTPPIQVLDGTNSGNTDWTFVTASRPQFVQSVSSTGASAVSLTLPFYPVPGDTIVVPVSSANETFSAPTDNAGNAYALVASSTFSNDHVGIYYAENITSTSSLTVTVNGSGGGELSASALEFIGTANSTTLQTFNSNVDTSGLATLLTSNQLVATHYDELYFGAMTFGTSTTASGGWTQGAGVATTNGSTQALYIQYMATSTAITTSSNWTAATGTSYAAIGVAFTPPYLPGYQASGTLYSSIYDTGVASGTQLNSFEWNGSLPGDLTNSDVRLQFAVSDSSSGPWVYKGPNGTSNPSDYFSGNAGQPISLLSTNQGYALFSGYRYYRYAITLYADPNRTYTPVVSGVTVNWSP